MDKPTPRINSSLRENYVERTVRIAGKILSVGPFFSIFVYVYRYSSVLLQFTGETAVIEATDHGHVMIKVNGVRLCDAL